METTPSSTSEIIPPVTPLTPPEERRKSLLPLLLAAIVIVLIGGGYFAYTQLHTAQSVAARVNGVAITEAELSENMRLITKIATENGTDTETPEARAALRETALTELINNTLILSAAEKEGISITDEEVLTTYTALVERMGGSETFAAELAKIEMTDEQLRTNIRERLTTDRYFEKVTDIETLTVTQEEIDTVFAGITVPEGENLPRETLEPQVRASLLQEKQNEMIRGLIDSLRAGAEIVITPQ